MKERIKDLAKQAGFDFDDYYDSVTQEELERFAELVRQDEREHIKKENQRCYVESEKYRSQK